MAEMERVEPTIIESVVADLCGTCMSLRFSPNRSRLRLGCLA